MSKFVFACDYAHAPARKRFREVSLTELQEIYAELDAQRHGYSDKSYWTENRIENLESDFSLCGWILNQMLSYSRRAFVAHDEDGYYFAVLIK